MRRCAAVLILLLVPGVLPGLAKIRFQVDEDLIGLSPPWQVAVIVGATLISEDLTCIAVGTLIGNGKISWAIGLGACFLGIYVGDLLFFLIGRMLGGRVLRVRFFVRSLGQDRLRRFGEWFDRRPWAAIAAARVLPGLRVPLYVTVGALSTRTRAFFWWTALFAFVWTPLLIAAVAFLGDTLTDPLHRLLGQGWWTIVIQIVVFYLVVRFIILMSTAAGRNTLARRFTWPVRWLRGEAAPAKSVVASELAAEADALLRTEEAKP
jgi:membrane protein DedA with SNARE-associated domain